MEDKKQLVAWVPEELHRKARVKSAQTGRPISEVIREALRRWVEETPPTTEGAQ